MGIDINWSNITDVNYNNINLDKVYLNTNLVFQKNTPIYKRRIMVGDNLKGKYVYGEFPENFYNNIPSVSLDQDSNDRPFVTYTNGNVTEYGSYGIYDMHYTDFIAQVGCRDCIGDGRDYVHQLLYDWIKDDREINDYVLIDNSKDHIVTEVLNYPSYRYCYIEDANIRPIKIGDKIRNETKFYFLFPDNIADQITSEAVNGPKSLIYTDNYDIEIQIFGMGSLITGCFSDDRNQEVIFNFDDGENINLSTFTSVLSEPKIIKFADNEYSKYILVDTTTLG